VRRVHARLGLVATDPVVAVSAVVAVDAVVTVNFVIAVDAVVAVDHHRCNPTVRSLFVRCRRDCVSRTDDPIRLLHIDDDAAFCRLVGDALEHQTDDIVVETAADAVAALDRLDRGDTVDCLLSDYEMPGVDGLEFLAGVRDRRPRLPFVLYTSRTDEELVARALATGVTAHVEKDTGGTHYLKLGNHIRRAVSEARAEASVDRLTAALDATREGVCVVDADGRVKYANRAYLTLYGYDREELLGEPWERLEPAADAGTVVTDVLPFVEEHGEWGGETVGERADGSTVEHDATVTETPDGELVVTAREFERNGEAG